MAGKKRITHILQSRHISEQLWQQHRPVSSAPVDLCISVGKNRSQHLSVLNYCYHSSVSKLCVCNDTENVMTEHTCFTASFQDNVGKCIPDAFKKSIIHCNCHSGHSLSILSMHCKPMHLAYLNENYKSLSKVTRDQTTKNLHWHSLPYWHRIASWLLLNL